MNKCQKSKIFENFRKRQGFFQKKGQGLPLEIIVIAAVVLVVAVVLIFIFKGESNKFVKSSSCAAREGVCLDKQKEKVCPEGKQIKIYTSDCKEMAQKEDGTYELKKDDKQKDVGSPGQCCISLA